ncbi:MAG TPA: hypothetical protein V6C52_06275 [Coleofasciculaceae cyanobacterium]|jgi:hypothetical protein
MLHLGAEPFDTRKRKPSLRFSGYSLTPSGQARLFLPGFDPAHGTRKIEAEAILPGQEAPQPIPLERRGDYWISRQPVPLGTNYRFLVDGKPRLDQVEVVHPLQDPAQPFNRVSACEAVSPRKSGVMADLFLDSLLSREQLDNLTHENAGILPMRDHFKLFGGNEVGLFQAIPHLKQAGFTSLLFKPFIGGDNLSSHRYWTIDPYILNNSFSNKAAFRQFLKTTLANDLKIFADGAFVNQGFNGVQKLANLTHGFQSPYWNWFTYNETPEGTGPLSFPKHAFEKESWGILPVVEDDQGNLRVAHERYALRVVNDPAKPGYDPRDFTFAETYDPNTETSDGKPLKAPYPIKSSRDSIQKLRIPVTSEELEDKRSLLNKPASQLSDEDRARLCEWQSVRLVADYKDDSGFKWDGQTDVAKMNMRNPEVVKYMEGAVAYWTRTVTNSHIDTIARALAKAQKDNPQGQPTALIQTITQRPGEQSSGLKVLPPVTFPALETLTRDEAERALSELRLCNPEALGQVVAGQVLQEYPLSALELPVMFKAALSHPGLQDALEAEPKSRIVRLMNMLFAPLVKIPMLGGAFKTIRNALAPTSFEQALSEKMDEVTRLLTPEAQEKMCDERIRSVMTERLAESLYMKIFTDLDDTANKSPEEIGKAFLDTIPQGIYRNDPETAATLLPSFMRRRLKHTHSAILARLLEKNLADLDPKLAAIAHALAEKRELGLNWRLDAAKDMANMDVIKNTEIADRPEVFLNEIDSIKSFWKQLSGTVHGIFKRSSIIAEFTDFFPFSGNHEPIVREATRRLYEDNTFNGMVNWNYTYHQLHQLVHYDQRPDELGGNQIPPSEFLLGWDGQHGLYGMSRELPFPVLRQYQNISSCHDQITSSHGLLMNPAIAFMDLVKWWGLKDDLNEVCNELKSKACFEDARQQIGVPDLGGTLGKLMELLQKPEVKGKLSPDLQHVFDSTVKGEKKGELSEPPPTSADLKPRFVNEVFKIISPEMLGIDKIRHEALRQALTARMTEPSESRAMRAVMVNGLLSFNWDEMPPNHRLNPEQRAQFNQSFWKALDKTLAQWGRHFGYQPADIALTRVFRNMSIEPDLPEFTKNQAFQDELKTRLFNHINRPVMEKLLRIFAIQTAMPGNPSIYLQDFFARGGGEWMKNIFVQNRNLLPVHLLTGDPNSDFRKFYEQAGAIFRSRSASVDPSSVLTQKGFPPEAAMALRQSCASALNDGAMLDVLPPQPPEGQPDPEFDRIKQNMDESGILPMVRDNGRDQVIVLVNTGKPRDSRGDYNDRIGTGPGYKEILPEKPVVENHKPDLSHLQLAPGTRYIDINTGEAFRLNEAGLLVNEQNPEKGVDVHISRFLVRENKQTAPHPDAAASQADEPPPSTSPIPA